MWSVRVLSGQQAGQIFDLKPGKNIIGRGGESHFKVKSLGISKEHCEIHVYKDKMMVVDLKSSNGTFLNGIQIQNAIVRVGDKVSLFDVIMDILPTPEVRPKPTTVDKPIAAPMVQRPPAAPRPLVQNVNQINSSMQNGNLAMQLGTDLSGGYPQQTPPPLAFVPPQSEANKAAPVAPLTLKEKMDNYLENVVMPGIYKLGVVFSFKQILVFFVLILIFTVTLLSAIPLTNIIKDSNMAEATKRAKSIARAMAKLNEQSLLNGQINNLSVQEALKEDGIKEAIIVQHSDGAVVAPSEKVGREQPNAMVIMARKESRAVSGRIDSNTIGASFPIAVYDPNTGEAVPKYHAVVTYDIRSLNIDDDKVVSLFMQTLMIASVFGLLLYVLFSKLIDYPIVSLNKQIEKSLLDQTDRTEVAFDYPVFQQLVSNVNTVLNRAWSGNSTSSSKPQQNKDVELSNIVEMINHPAMVLDADLKVLALNNNFEILIQADKNQILNQSYQLLNDTALVQNIDSLVVRAKQNPYEKQADRIPFSQYECEIFCQVLLGTDAEPQYFILTLVQVV